MKFRVPPHMEPSVRVSKEVPLKYARYRIPNADAEFIEGDFGAFLTQELITPLWAIGWLNFFITGETHLYPTTAAPMVALYSTIDGNIPCVLEGFGELVLQNRRYGFYYIPPEVKNEAFFTVGDYDAIYISFAPQFLVQFIDQHPQFRDLYNRQQEQVLRGQVLPSYQIKQNELDILNKIRYHKHTGKTQEIFLQARINDILVCYFMIHEADGLQESLESELEGRIQDTASYINHNLYLPFTVADLSKRTKLNLDKFEKAFKHYLGKSPQKFIEDARMQEAVNLLLGTDVPIADIAYKVGYADQSYFSKVFKRMFGLSPRIYRQQHQ